MSAYLIAQLKITDPAAFERYRDKVPEVIELYGGRYLVRGGTTEVLEGALPMPRLVVIVFPSMADAKRFYHSPEYQEIIGLRTAASEGIVTLVDGVPET